MSIQQEKSAEQKVDIYRLYYCTSQVWGGLFGLCVFWWSTQVFWVAKTANVCDNASDNVGSIHRRTDTRS